ncbi:MAG: bifunctional diaminohydroxyphosphoribosylaminopyrimidine deaminase/5-amino-6-(5-phosphoribosylamino)uracil reductase RibD [Desulfobacteraceae bacterium]|nr:MAG: bifunctional diaminohydroxyphosphoribosylaminopyrimidine deaminase/5-amino-6-(5-phosphoribosylamino)uracil reductase RibD [Desulfobacteraceae bacterium]
MNDDDYMALALALAARGAGYVSPNPLVGAVVIKDDQVVGQGYHQAVGAAHAEVNAIDDAGERASGATLYVTLEPCHHFGRTPPCTEKIVAAGIRRVVAAMADPNPDVQGGGNDFLQSRGIEVVCGVKEREARQLNESFIKFVTTRQPFVVLKMAATLDGRIATRTGDARWVTGEAARSRVHRLRHAMDAILVGIGTVKSDDPSLTARPAHGKGVDPIRLVLDTRLSMSKRAQMLTQVSNAPTYVVCGPDASEMDHRRLVASGARILESPVKKGRIDLNALMGQLGRMGITSLLIEGGAQVAGSALAADIVDKMIIFYAPKVTGGDDGVSMFRGQGAALMKDALTLQDMTVEMVGEDIMVQGYLKKFEI